MASLAKVFRGSLFLMSPAAGTAAGSKAAGSAAGSKAAGAAAVVKAKAAAAKMGEKATSTEPRPLTGITMPLNGITMLLPVSEELSRFAGGAPEVARGQAVKLVWARIKAHGLQDPAKKTEINCDATLKSLFGGRDRIGMMEIAKLLEPHFLKN